MSDKLVSVITPCYNSAGFIHRLLDSILDQDYPCVEMITVDDGSVDRTKEVIESYIPKFNRKGYSLTYLYQKNSGQSVAINKALKIIRGVYLVWPDSDDYYASPVAISRMVSVLENSNDSVSMVRCLFCYLDEKKLVYRGKVVNRLYPEKLFEDCLFGRNGYWFLAGGYMVKTAVLDICIANREIYTEKNAGQNWQLMLPLLYRHQCLTIREYLYNVLIRSSSHSRGQYKTFEEVQAKFQSYENTLVSTLEKIPFMPLAEKDRYIEEIHKKYLKIRFETCLRYRNKKEARLILERLNKEYHDNLTLRQKIDYNFCVLPGYLSCRKWLSVLIHRIYADCK